MDNPLVSIVIVTWNRREDVLVTLQSVEEQRYKPVEVIVVDNASTDGTTEAIRQAYPHVSIIPLEKNRGASGGRNPGIQAARGEIVFILDSDASLDAHTLESVVEKFQARPELGVIACKVVNAQTKTFDHVAGWIFSENKKGDQDSEFLSYSFSECGCAFRKQVFERAGLFSESLFFGAEGEELSLSIWDAGYPILYYPRAIVYHRVSPQQRVDSRERHYYKLRNALHIYLMRYPWWLLALYAPLKMAALFITSVGRGYLPEYFRALWDVLRQIPDIWKQRQPIRHETARRYLHLLREHGPLSWNPVAWLRYKVFGQRAQVRLPETTNEDVAGLRVCMVVHQYYYRDGRVQRYARALAEAGARVDVLCLRDKKESQGNDGVRVITIPLSRGYKSRGSYLLEYGAALILFIIWLTALHVRNRYDIVHVHNMPDFLVFSALIARLLGAQVILDIHDPMPEVYLSKFADATSSKAVRLMQLQEKLSAKAADAMIAANANFKEKLVGRGIPASKITVVNNIADDAIFNRNQFPRLPNAANGSFTLIYPGTIAPRYGLDIPIRALPLLVGQIPQVRFIVLGPYVSHVDELKALAGQLAVSEHVIFKPAVPVAEVPYHLSQADVGIYTAIPDPYMVLTTPTKVLEYAAMGLPIITSRFKTIEELFGESSVAYFEPGNVEEFAKRVIELHQNPKRREALVQQADRVYVCNHTWHNERKRYFELLKRL
jgi:GT2 family glycosyltransferase